MQRKAIEIKLRKLKLNAIKVIFLVNGRGVKRGEREDERERGRV